MPPEATNDGRELLANLARLVPGVIYRYRLFPDGRSAFPCASPGMNGRELAQRLRGIRPGLRQLNMSGYTTDVLAPLGVRLRVW